LFLKCKAEKFAKVMSISRKQTKKLRPIPLNTISAQKLISNKLKISSSKSMEIMEKLYN
jgi:DNA topoisomerase IA